MSSSTLLGPKTAIVYGGSCRNNSSPCISLTVFVDFLLVSYPISPFPIDFHAYFIKVRIVTGIRKYPNLERHVVGGLKPSIYAGAKKRLIISLVCDISLRGGESFPDSLARILISLFDSNSQLSTCTCMASVRYLDTESFDGYVEPAIGIIHPIIEENSSLQLVRHVLGNIISTVLQVDEMNNCSFCNEVENELVQFRRTQAVFSGYLVNGR